MPASVRRKRFPGLLAPRGRWRWWGYDVRARITAASTMHGTSRGSYNNRISGERTVGSVALTLIKVRDERLGDTEDVPTGEGLVTPYSSRVRTLVDAVYDWARFGSLPRGYGWCGPRLLPDESVRPS
jgi:hypothetical protein